MPWQEHRTVDLREELVLRAKEPGANVSELCRAYGISRKTAYKWLRRFDAGGLEALKGMSRRPRRVVQTSGEIVLRIQEFRRAHPRWGAKKLRVLLAREFGVEVPSRKTIDRVLERLGEPRLRKPWKRVLSDEREVPKHQVQGANDEWTVDFKGWWRAGDGTRCEPLTVRDQHSRYVLCTKLLSGTSAGPVHDQFERLFMQYGLPVAIHVDNGSPFGSTRARCGLTKLSAWWVALGIRVVFSRPSHPEDNGGHERMHLDLRFDIEDHACIDAVSQQAALDAWVLEFNTIRPHEALQMRTPAQLYRRSPRVYRGPRPARYPIGFDVRTVAPNGSIKYKGQKYFVSEGLACFQVGIDVASGVLRAFFYELALGELHAATRRTNVSKHLRFSAARCSARSPGKAPRSAPEPHGKKRLRPRQS